MDPPRPVLAATHRARESLRLDDQNEPSQGNQQVDLPRSDFEIREDDGRAPVVVEQSRKTERSDSCSTGPPMRISSACAARPFIVSAPPLRRPQGTATFLTRS